MSSLQSLSPRGDQQLVSAFELRPADFARHLWLSARPLTARAYLDVLQRLAALGVDPMEAERGDLERFLARPRRDRRGDWQGRLSASYAPGVWSR